MGGWELISPFSQIGLAHANPGSAAHGTAGTVRALGSVADPDVRAQYEGAPRCGQDRVELHKGNFRMGVLEPGKTRGEVFKRGKLTFAVLAEFYLRS